MHFNTIFKNFRFCKDYQIQRLRMKFLEVCVVISLLAVAKGQNDYNENPDLNTCEATVERECYKAGSSWNGGSACSAVYGGFKGNEHNLNLMMKNHLKDSFTFLIMVSYVKYYRYEKFKWLHS